MIKLKLLLSFLFLLTLNIGFSCGTYYYTDALYDVNGPDLSGSPCSNIDFGTSGFGVLNDPGESQPWMDYAMLSCGSTIISGWYSLDGIDWYYYDHRTYTFTMGPLNPVSGTCSGGGATPTISVSGSLSSFTSCSGIPSVGQSFTVSASDLTGNLTITAPTGYEVSSNNSTYQSFISIVPAFDGTVAPLSVYVRLTSSASNGASGNVQCTSSGATQKDVATGSGTVNTTPTITSVTNNDRCGSGTVNLAASASAGTIKWYPGSSSNILVNTGTTYTPSISTTTIYYVDATDNGCTTGSRTLVTGTVYSMPSTQASSFSSSNISSTTATVGWNRGNGDKVLVLARQGGAVDSDPADGNSYTANAAFGSGNEIGTGNYVVYVGTGTSVDLTSLSSSSTYHLAIYEYETGNSCNLYNLTQLTGNFTSGAANNDPVISAPNSGSAYTANYEENGTGNVADVNATDSDGDALTYSLSGDDAADFSINSSTGVITFASTPNFENPQDANTNNEYIFTVTVSDGNGGSDTQNYTITVTNASSESATSNGNGNWNTSGTWGDGVPGSGDNVTINNDINVDANVSCNNLTVNASDELTVNSSRTLTVSGTTDVNGVITVNGTLDINGTFDATGATVNLGSSGKLILNGSVTSLGTLDALEGTVEYDGGTQNVIADAYYNLEIDQSGTKTAQGTITVAGTMTVQSAATYALAATSTTVTGASDINGVLTASTGTYDANGSFDATGATIDFSDAATLKLEGTITSLGALDETDGTIELDGSSSQDLPTDTYNSLKINNAAGVVLEGNTTINGTLTMTLGDLTSSSSKLLTIKSSMSGASASSHVVGPVKYASSSTSSCVVGIGTGTLYHPVTLAAVSASAENYTVEYRTGTPFNSGTLDWDTYPNVGVPINSSNVQYVSNDYYYDITRSGGVNAYITISFSGVGIASPPAEADQYLMHYNSSTNRWDEMTTTHPTSTTVRALATSFSPFGPGSGGGALPIDLVSFTGKCENHTIELEFVVGSQINNDYYTIERSVDGNEWSDVGIIQGEGNTSTQMTYKWIDDNPMSGVNYYRLTQTDYDGTSEIFAPVALTCEMTPIDDYSVYPNPADGLLNIDIELENYQGEGVSIEVTDINGRAVKNQIVQLKRGFNHLELDLNNIPGGIYMINFVGSRDYIKESRITKK